MEVLTDQSCLELSSRYQVQLNMSVPCWPGSWFHYELRGCSRTWIPSIRHRNILGQTQMLLHLIKIHYAPFLIYVHSKCLNILDTTVSLCTSARSMFPRVFYVQTVLWHTVTNDNDDAVPLGNWLQLRSSSSPCTLLPTAWRKLFAVGCKGEAGGFSCFSTVQESETSLAFPLFLKK